MNILYIDHYAGSPEMGMEFRPYYLSREWIRMGHRVSIIAGSFSHLRRKNPIVEKDMQHEEIDGIDYYWMMTGTYEGNGVSRAITMFRFFYKLARWKKWIDRHLMPDVVISSSTYPIDAIPAHWIAKRKGVKIVHIHEVHDMWPATLTEIGGMSKIHPFVIIMQIGENFAYKYSDAVVSLLKYAKPYMKKHGLADGRFAYIPNGVTVKEWEYKKPIPKGHQLAFQNLKESGKFIVGYFGGHALSNCLFTFVQAAERIDSDKVQFVLVGDGVEKENLIQYARQHELSNMTFLPPVDKKEIPDLLCYFDCIYIGATDSPLYRFGVCMNKMFDGMMAQKAIIFAINAPATPITDSNCGIVIKPENPDEINLAIKQIMEMPPDERRRMGLRGKEEVVKHYTYQELANRFINIMNLELGKRGINR